MADKKYTFQEFTQDIEQYESRYRQDINLKSYFGFPLSPILESETQLSSLQKSIAYFSMEYGLAPSIYNSFSLSQPMNDKNQFFKHEVFSNYWLCDYLFKVEIDKMLDIPIYGGGLGVLAGDTMKSVADLGCPVVGIGVLWNKGYFKQKFWYKRGQVPDELEWDPWAYPGLVPLKKIVTIDTQQGPLHLRLWKYYVYSFDKTKAIPLILLDSNLEENQDRSGREDGKLPFRRLTDQLYRSDDVLWKIFQRLILGVGGMKALKALGYHVDCYHLNEGHAAFAILEKYINLEDKSQMNSYRDKFVFTCHTPVAAGHDRFEIKDINKILKPEYVEAAQIFGKESPHAHQINLTYMSLNNCSRVNAVAAKHGEVMRLQFPQYAQKIGSITNGVHTHTWTSQSFQNLFDKYSKAFGDWRAHPENLKEIMTLSSNSKFRADIFEAHQVNKRNLMNILNRWRVSEDIFTIGWARRIAGYKRPALIFHNVERIIQLAQKYGQLQIILAGKAHPNDNIGAAHIDEILDHIDQLNPYKDLVRVLILENYDTFFGKLLTNSVDVWLNNPLPPFEASGTSGMKAIHNGVLQLSTLDGWVVEAADKDIGWIFGYEHHGSEIGDERNLRLDEDSKALYDRLEEVVGLYYQTLSQGKVNVDSPWIDKMIHCVAQSAFFNTQRMVEEYREKMWQLK
ncbi:MAG: alpha-glucan family phosphorylase [Candidatus Omnitrophica bacterium]|nr:alpha-glucan family phosphorylase [Candidatus Omnitrophota bacterium]